MTDEDTCCHDLVDDVELCFGIMKNPKAFSTATMRSDKDRDDTCSKFCGGLMLDRPRIMLEVLFANMSDAHTYTWLFKCLYVDIDQIKYNSLLSKMIPKECKVMQIVLKMHMYIHTYMHMNSRKKSTN